MSEIQFYNGQWTEIGYYKEYVLLNDDESKNRMFLSRLTEQMINNN